MADKPKQQTFYRTDEITGETTERIVSTPADEVRAKFDGYHPKSKGSSSSSSSSSSSAKPAGSSTTSSTGSEPSATS